jgi:hypothetical protein
LLWFSQGFGGQGFGGQGAGGQGAGGQGFGPQAGGSPNPYANTFGPQQPPPKKSNLWLWILGGLGIGTVLLIACCGGLSYMAVNFSNKVVTEALRNDLSGNPVVDEHLGEIQSLNTNLMESGAEKQRRNTSVNILVIDAEGSKGTGKFVVEQSPNPQPGNFFQKIDLRLPSGVEVSIK